ncbi:hypothetical protein SS1G_01726 [Sclerotinia sclerotiorum 1980 UF-70]|uniref:Nicotianamine synthase n=1 Tax=Sclerotinia sclerotiorum (strain ATCC 18683 / 1980 / Ss-1) TaxID=665079 RepID=A7E8U8_SCLS1|nr:hypothetical protein SS1G_01726 [Sclerotinia sclerotiorum 1980 UF-70]EDN96800.1 hypothetical protein SS1G_01726 [Sclerotinia sclerotiorum 1980 UF-70]
MSNMDRMTTCSLLSSIKELFQKSQTPSASSKRSSTSIVPIPDLGKLDIIENTTCPQTEFYVQEILSIYTLLSQLTDFSPSPTINVLFSDLVGTCITIVPDSISKGVLGDPRISSILPALRVICSTAEASHRVLATFPYHKNYERLTRFELAAISSTGFFLSPTTKIAFIGSGPMPLTSLCILSALSTSDHMSCTLSSNSSIPLPLPRQSPVTPPTIITNIDSNPTANTQAQNLCTSLGGLPSTGMRFITALAGSNDLDLSDYDIIWLAALVGGIQADKEEILKNVVRKMKKGSLLIMRGAWGLRSVLYCDFDVTTQAVSTYLDICVRMDPFGDVVNSVIVGRVK